MTIRVFIADNHDVLRASLRMFINAQRDMEVVGEAANGPAAEAGISETDADVALMDISMPGGGIAAVAGVKRRSSKTRIVMLTGHDQAGYVRAAADAGAVGYVLKSAVDTDLLQAIRAAAQGRTFMSAETELGIAKPSMKPPRAETPTDEE